MGFAILLIAQSCSFYMLGVIWIIQLLQYPQFCDFHESVFPRIHEKHTAAMGLLVGFPMICELLTAIWLVYYQSTPGLQLNLALVLLLWLLTFTVSVPLHSKLTQGFNSTAAQKLTTTNWLRTLLWTFKAVVITSELWGQRTL